MRDEMDGRLWDAHGHAFSENLHRLFSGIGEAIKRFYRAQRDAPWQHAAAQRSRAGQA
jgi:hypothetical protein